MSDKVKEILNKIGNYNYKNDELNEECKYSS